MAEDLILSEISTDVINSINTNFSEVEDAVNAKAELHGDSTQVFNVADAVELTEAINKGQLDSSVVSINSDISDLETIVSAKSDKVYVDTNIALKANTTDVQTALAAKADLNGNNAQVFNVADAAAPTQAISKGQLDSTLSEIITEIDSIKAKIDSELINGYRFPDYSNGASKTWGATYTAECDGWLKLLIVGGNRQGYLYIDGVLVCDAGNDMGAYHTVDSILIPVSKGSTYYTTEAGGGSMYAASIIFYPAKGTN